MGNSKKGTQKRSRTGAMQLTERRNDKIYETYLQLINPDIKKIPVYKKIGEIFFMTPGAVRNIINQKERSNK